MATKRKFQSIQVIAEGNGVALIAIADDGTAWTARTYATGGYMNHENLEWKQITELPANESVSPRGVWL